MSEIYAMHRKQVLAVNTVLGIASFHTEVFEISKYKNLSFIFRSNSGVATVDFRTGIDSAMTVAMSGAQNALALGVTEIASFSALYGSHMEVKVSGIVSATNVLVNAYGLQT